MSHHPERTARNVRPVNQPPSLYYIPRGTVKSPHDVARVTTSTNYFGGNIQSSALYYDDCCLATQVSNPLQSITGIRAATRF